MGRHCEICETHEAECEDPRVHLSRTEAGKRVVQEMLYGRWEEQSRVDVEKGRETPADAWECGLESEERAEAVLAWKQELEESLGVWCRAQSEVLVG